MEERIRLWRLLVRGATRRCPRCGARGQFHRWVTMATHCHRCGVRFERGEGFMLGVMAINIGVCSVLFVGYLAAGFALTWPDPPVVTLTAVGVALLLAAPFAVYPFAKTIWAAIDLYMRPLDVADQAEALTYLALPIKGRSARVDHRDMDAGRGERDERGFSLVELMVVVLVVAILIAIAIPTFMGARQTSNERATQANVRNAFTATRVYYNEHNEYSADATAMRDVEPSLLWTSSALDDASASRAVRIVVYDTPSTAQTVVVVARTPDGRCFYLRDVMGGADSGTYYQRDVNPGAQCPDVDPATITAVDWRS